MELKNYQLTNLEALDRFLSCVEEHENIADAYTAYWKTNNPPVTPMPGAVVEPYRNNVKGAPHICHKVPTGGGKTLIAAAALKVAVQHIRPQYRVVVWLVPSNAILEQTLRNLRDKEHPYRQRIDTDFQNRVVVLDKQQALTGQGFTLASARENLTLLVMSSDSFRTQNEEGRKVYQENGYLQSFAPLVSHFDGIEEEVHLVRVLQAVRPIVVVDESHNATSSLSEEMLNNLHPSLVIDLTATPRKNSNVICFTDALELKRNNMVKLPVIVCNHTNKSQVMDKALHLQRQLELAAREQAEEYIRPIVLFQAESRLATVEDRETFEKVKNTLLEVGIPEEQIKIKTATIDELKGVDLMSKECPVRYIITINALKEGWDCPFAYILASLADRSSTVDVEQIVGRVLRRPYAHHNSKELLNLSYVLTASTQFHQTLENVVKGLNYAGFSSSDYRQMDETTTNDEPAIGDQMPLILGKPETEEDSDSLDKEKVTFRMNAATYNSPTEMASKETTPTESKTIDEILQNAERVAEEMNCQQDNTNEIMIPNELIPAVKTGAIHSAFVASASQVRLPQFFMKDESPQTAMTLWQSEDVKFDGQHLMNSFKLSKQKADFNFAAAATNMYKVDIDQQTDGHTPTLQRVNGPAYKYILEYIREAKNAEDMRQRCSAQVVEEIRKMNHLTERDTQDYVERIFTGLSEADLEDFMQHMYEYTRVIKDKIMALEEAFKEEEFIRMLDSDKIFCKPSYEMKRVIPLSDPIDDITKMLHSKEEAMNGFEREVIIDVANLDNVEWWTRNVEKRDFCINGFINHYPDFIIKTKKGKVVLLETKGDHLSAEKKIKLGNLWANKAGNDYRYFLVYNKREESGAYTKSGFLDILQEL